ncbi:tyrosine-type recombinase/integrase [Nonomuraea endophytica]|uniref:tyrosine-type recombinase/integrase n=1 Tax=Nonomuraea endophytica TaxID=714136 RepID=UPI001C858DC8
MRIVHSRARPADTIRLLRSHQRSQHLHGLDAAGWVFTRKDGQPIRPDYLTYRFRRLVAASGLPPVRPHDLRHSAASTALAARAWTYVRSRASSGTPATC